ncbi:9081_t:CDS:2, partial [Dentiscutata heterogama]
MLTKSFVFIALSIISIGFVLSGQANPLPDNNSPQLLKRSICTDGSFYMNKYVEIPCDFEVVINLEECEGLSLKKPVKFLKIKTPKHGIYSVNVKPTHKTYEYSEEHKSSASSSSH